MSEPVFVPKPGQVDYTHIRYAPCVDGVVVYDGKILLVQRSDSMRLYPGYWSGVTGFLDDQRSIEEKLFEELEEELGITAAQVVSMERGSVILQEAPDYNKTWLIAPVLVRVTTDRFTLNWESQAAGWYLPAEIGRLQLLPGFQAVIDQLAPKIEPFHPNGS